MPKYAFVTRRNETHLMPAAVTDKDELGEKSHYLADFYDIDYLGGLPPAPASARHIVGKGPHDAEQGDGWRVSPHGTARYEEDLVIGTYED